MQKSHDGKPWLSMRRKAIMSYETESRKAELLLSDFNAVENGIFVILFDTEITLGNRK